MPSSPGLVVVGASLAGLRAVEAARSQGYEGTITLIGTEKHLPYDRPPLSKAFLEAGTMTSEDYTRFRSIETLTVELAATFLAASTATGLDTAARVVRTTRGDVPYETLIIATGSSARSLPGSGALAGVHTFRTLEDAIAVRRALNAGARTVVIGAGFIGSEVAASARKRGLPVTIIEALPAPLTRAVGRLMGEALAGLHKRNGTELRCGIGVRSIEGSGSVERVVLEDGTVLDADLVVVGIGANPATEWLQSSGLALDNGIVCDEKLATSVPDVYAAGDVARWYNPLFGRHMRLEHWTSAAEQGGWAARNALGFTSKPYQTVPYFWSDWYEYRIQFVGIPSAEEIEVVDGVATGDHFVALYREGDRLVGALTLNGRAQIMKYRGLIAKRATWSEGLAFAEARRVVT